MRWLAGLALVACVGLTLHHFVFERPIARGPGMVASTAPLQESVGERAPTFDKANFHVTALATFALEARVLSAKTYCCNRQAGLVPVDVAFGWGRMSDEAVLERIDISQSGRFYWWRYKGPPPIPRREIERSSANMHLIASTAAIERRLKRLRPGNIVTVRGWLVEARTDDFVWTSSLTREDTGNGACELVWVDELEVR